MSHELDRKIAYAYNPEGQAIAVSKSQKTGRFLARGAWYAGIELKQEEGLSWITLLGHGTTLLAHDCNAAALEGVYLGTPITFIEDSTRLRPDIAFGRQQQVVAAVLVGEEVFYKSPGFNLERFVKQETRKRKKK